MILRERGPSVQFLTSYLSLGQSFTLCLMSLDGALPTDIRAPSPLRAVQSSIDLPTCAAGLYSSMQCQLNPSSCPVGARPL